MASPNQVLQDDEAFLWRQTMRRLDRLEALTQNDVPVGSVVGIRGPVRSAAWSASRADAINPDWTYWYRLNNLTHVRDASGDVSFDGVLDGGVNVPALGQPGGLSSEGSYSAYFDSTGSGSNTCRISLPLMLASQMGWSIEMIFRPDGLPQLGCIAHNGLASTNGYGIFISDGAGASGSKLSFRSAATQWIDTGITLNDNQWYAASFVADDVSNNLIWYVATIAQPSKVFTYSTGSAAMTTPVMPTTASYLGADRPAGTRPFRGWIDDALFFQGKYGSSGRGSAQDHVRVAIEPGPPTSWLKTDGTAVGRSKYARLFAAIGTTDGVGDGTTTFALPNIAGSIIKA
jgi:Phage Tail Collar Domain